MFKFFVWMFHELVEFLFPFCEEFNPLILTFFNKFLLLLFNVLRKLLYLFWFLYGKVELIFIFYVLHLRIKLLFIFITVTTIFIIIKILIMLEKNIDSTFQISIKFFNFLACFLTKLLNLSICCLIKLINLIIF